MLVPFSTVIKTKDIHPLAVYFPGRPIRIIIPTASSNGDNFKKCMEHISRSELPEGTFVTVVISSGSDFSFSKSINYALSMVRDEDILLLNDDCFVRGNAIKNVISSIKENDGVVGALLYYPDGSIQHNGGILYFNPVEIFFKDLLNGAPLNPIRSLWKAKRAHTKYVRAFHNKKKKPKRIDFVTGAFFFIPNKAFHTIGYMDEGFVNGFEDADYCLRAKNLGLGVRVEESAEAIHKEHASLKAFSNNFMNNIINFNKKWNRNTVNHLRNKND
jgi:GT2 family glycosyltransferase